MSALENQIDILSRRYSDVHIPEMVSISPGYFIQGELSDANAVPLRKVELRYQFFVGKFPTTVHQYLSLMGSHSVLKSIPEDNWSLPVTEVTWIDAMRYCAKLSELTHLPFRLLTESEWEYIARAGSEQQIFPWGNSINMLKDHAWYDQNTKTLQPVGGKLANAWGVHDLLGLVDEFTLDCFASYENGPMKGGPKLSSSINRVVRGGHYFQEARYISCGGRGCLELDEKSNCVGFRIALGGPYQRDFYFD